ncbi:MAG: hypothetical protein AAF514_15930 [Verrucomicrobiota bacterium]
MERILPFFFLMVLGLLGVAFIAGAYYYAEPSTQTLYAKEDQP